MDENAIQDVSSCQRELLDQEAHQFSHLIMAVQKRFSEGGDRVGADLFAWAEQLEQSGRAPEAEFLYLHAIGWCERLCDVVYPVIFHGLRDYAHSLLDRIQQQSAITGKPADVLIPAAAETLIAAPSDAFGSGPATASFRSEQTAA
ncbi:MAG TPA: hypothetical protein V6D22_05775 [Candidatus Obscuribacterales bacterium]